MQKVWDYYLWSCSKNEIIVIIISNFKHCIDIFQYGEIEEMNVCDNLGDHLVGNVYVKFRYEEDAEKAVESLNNRWYNGKILVTHGYTNEQNYKTFCSFPICS